MKAILPHSVLALDKIPELKIPEEIGGQISAYESVIASSTWEALHSRARSKAFSRDARILQLGQET